MIPALQAFPKSTRAALPIFEIDLGRPLPSQRVFQDFAVLGLDGSSMHLRPLLEAGDDRVVDIADVQAGHGRSPSIPII
ncbi:MAG: hypothetical protein BGN94_20360 [Rhizobiales bacterium 68-8]|nr:MAG: hypothetical protein BGN94_20360 [Rhizobiales bacterium 68-8]